MALKTLIRPIVLVHLPENENFCGIQIFRAFKGNENYFENTGCSNNRGKITDKNEQVQKINK